MQHKEIENIAESVGIAQSIIETLKAYRLATNESLNGIDEDRLVLYEYAHCSLETAMENLSRLSNSL